MKKRFDHSTPELFDPIVFTPTIKVRQPNGDMLLKPGKPIVLNGEDEISTNEAASILGCSSHWVGQMCDQGRLEEGKDWRRIGTRGNYRIKRASILALRFPHGLPEENPK